VGEYMRISVDRLKPGMRLAENIYANASSKVPLITMQKRNADGVQVYTYLSENEIKQLKEKGIKTVKVELINDVKETLDDSIQDDVIQSLKDAVSTADLNIAGVIEAANKIVLKMLSTDKLDYSLSSYGLEANDFFKEAMDECSFAVALAKKYNNTLKVGDRKIDLEDMAVSCLLSKLGKFCEYDNDILKRIKPDKGLAENYFPGYYNDMLNSYNENYVPIYSYYMLKNNRQLGISSESVKLAVLLGGEDEVGKGPLKSSKDTLSSVDKKTRDTSVMMGKIIRICNVYEMLLNKCVEKRVSPSNVMELMGVLAANKRIDKNLFEIFKKAVPLYSPGIRVMLSDGRSGIVIKSDENFFDKPLIKLDSTGEAMDLKNETTVTITGIYEFDIDYAVYLVQNRDRQEMQRQGITEEQNQAKAR